MQNNSRAEQEKKAGNNVPPLSRIVASLRLASASRRDLLTDSPLGRVINSIATAHSRQTGLNFSDSPTGVAWMIRASVARIQTKRETVQGRVIKTA